MARAPAVPIALISRVAVRADVSVKSVRRYLAGVQVRGSTARRIEAAARDEGLPELIERRVGAVAAKESERKAA